MIESTAYLEFEYKFARLRMANEQISIQIDKMHFKCK